MHTTLTKLLWRHMPRLYKSEGKLGFDHDGFFITDPFVSECSRFVLDPIKDYALTKDQTNDMIQYNGLDEELLK